MNRQHRTLLKLSFIKKLRNRHFKKIFLKNWLTVFLSIVLPLTACVLFVHYNNQRTLLDEIDVSAQRSTLNVTSTLETLFQEACDTLEREVLDQNTSLFFSAKPSFPPSYSFITLVNQMKTRVNADYHDSLYYSLDCYSASCNFLVSTTFQGQFYQWVDDSSLTDAFSRYRSIHPDALLFAVRREALDADVITIYRSQPFPSYQDSFVSISIDPEKLVRYIVDAPNTKSSSFLLIDTDGKIVFDSSQTLVDTAFEIQNDTHSFTLELNGRLVRVFWTPLGLFDWKCAQIIPLDEYQDGIHRLQELAFWVILLAIVISTFISYGVTTRLFHPIEAILNAVENPYSYQDTSESDDELKYILLQILELFQKNITLENETLKRVIALRRLRANALQKQMSPHFLNNILNIINWTAIEETGNENSLTSQQLILLSDMIRTMKEQTGNLTTVAAEMEYTKKFMKLESLRFGPYIHCSYDIDGSILQAPIPAISLQTLVENAIAHGLQPKNAAGNICVRIAPNETEGLFISVEDDGIGMEQSKIDQIFSALGQEFVSAQEHIGLINLFQRFRLIYGDDCAFRIENIPGGGLRVVINTPRISPEIST